MTPISQIPWNMRNHAPPWIVPTGDTTTTTQLWSLECNGKSKITCHQGLKYGRLAAFIAFLTSNPIISHHKKERLFFLRATHAMLFYRSDKSQNKTWISNHTLTKLRGETTYPFLSFNGCTVEVWEWIRNFSLTHYDGCNYLSILGFYLIYISEMGPWEQHMKRCFMVCNKNQNRSGKRSFFIDSLV